MAIYTPKRKVDLFPFKEIFSLKPDYPIQAKIIVTPNLINWYTWNSDNNDWELVYSGDDYDKRLDNLPEDQQKEIIEKGFDYSVFQTLTWDQYSKLWDDNEPKFISFAYEILDKNEDYQEYIDKFLIKSKLKNSFNIDKEALKILNFYDKLKIFIPDDYHWANPLPKKSDPTLEQDIETILNNTSAYDPKTSTTSPDSYLLDDDWNAQENQLNNIKNLFNKYLLNTDDFNLSAPQYISIDNFITNQPSFIPSFAFTDDYQIELPDFNIAENTVKNIRFFTISFDNISNDYLNNIPNFQTQNSAQISNIKVLFSKYDVITNDFLNVIPKFNAQENQVDGIKDFKNIFSSNTNCYLNINPEFAIQLLFLNNVKKFALSLNMPESASNDFLANQTSLNTQNNFINDNKIFIIPESASNDFINLKTVFISAQINQVSAKEFSDDLLSLTTDDYFIEQTFLNLINNFSSTNTFTWTDDYSNFLSNFSDTNPVDCTNVIILEKDDVCNEFNKTFSANNTFDQKCYNIEYNNSSSTCFYREAALAFIFDNQQISVDFNKTYFNIQNYYNPDNSGGVVQFDAHAYGQVLNLYIKASGNSHMGIANIYNYYGNSNYILEFKNCTFDFSELQYDYLFYLNGSKFKFTDCKFILPTKKIDAYINVGDYYFNNVTFYYADTDTTEILNR